MHRFEFLWCVKSNRSFFKFPVKAALIQLFTLTFLWVYAANGQSCTPRIENFDGRNHAFITKGNQGTVNWVNTGGPSIWNLCRGGGGGEITINPFPTPNPDNNTNQIYIEIRAGDHVVVPSLSFHNNVTLVICGELTIGSLALASGDLEALNRVNIVVCPGGRFSLDRLEAQNNVNLKIDGVVTVNTIEGQTSNLCIWSPAGTGVIRTSTGGIPVITDRWRFGDPGAGGCTSTDPASGGIALPVELLSFTAAVHPAGVELKWETATEINNDFFTIERSSDLRMWEILGFVAGSGTISRPMSYTFADPHPLAGVSYYRLKQTDFDGQYEYFGPLAAHFELGLEGLEFRVIKQHDQWLITVPHEGVYTVQVYNLQGRKLISRETENLLSIEAPAEPVIIRITDGFSRSASQVFLNLR